MWYDCDKEKQCYGTDTIYGGREYHKSILIPIKPPHRVNNKPPNPAVTDLSAPELDGEVLALAVPLDLLDPKDLEAEAEADPEAIDPEEADAVAVAEAAALLWYPSDASG
jgi:hypothetical protein